MRNRRLSAAIVHITAEYKVIAFMSTDHLEPDIGAELFVLEPQASGG